MMSITTMLIIVIISSRLGKAGVISFPIYVYMVYHEVIQAKEKSDSFAEGSHRPKYNHLLHPRTTGFVHMVFSVEKRQRWWLLKLSALSYLSFIIYISQNVTGKGSDGPGYARFRFGLHYCLPGQVEIFFFTRTGGNIFVTRMLVFSIGFTKYAADCSHWCCFWCFPPSANVPISEGAVLRGALPSQVHLHITRWEIKIYFSLKVLSPAHCC